MLVSVYALFALSAGVRAAYQLATRFGEAPVAYVLSAVAAAVYLLAAVALARGTHTARVTATAALGFELAGVLAVGSLSLLVPGMFPDATVWSGFGAGYAFVPLVLPVAGLWWLRRHRAGPR